LIKDPAQRPTPAELLRHPFAIKAEANALDLKEWACSFTQVSA
jgi:hypothetical protein